MACVTKADVVILDKEKSSEVFQSVVLAWGRREKDFIKFEPPERKLRPKHIEYGSREHALWILACGHWSRSGQQANQAIGLVAQFAEKYPHFLDPLAKRSKRQWKEFIRYMLPTFPFNEAEKMRRLRHWLRTLEYLKFYGGDPRNIFHLINLSGDIREEIIDRLTDFPGVAHKIAQLTAQWFQEVDWPDESEFWDCFNKVPVSAIDIWLMRLVYQLGLVVEYTSEHRDRIGRPISDQIVEICSEHGIDHRALIQALWHIGARICALARRKKEPKRGSWCGSHCPVSRFCICIVPANEEKEGRGELCWSLAERRMVLLI